ncbi:hypothetical protein [Streptomyces sp. NBC_00989]|uniref:hypothetical protein n=1 Tax=Streptomyces sp. NBC_00989 TaxID=2903705 RepID=UPI003869DAD4|nr:hypothetical protein OG714_36280 [Streptomyces sp. NBC_00989]
MPSCSYAWQQAKTTGWQWSVGLSIKIPIPKLGNWLDEVTPSYGRSDSSPNKGAAPDVCDYTSADGRSTLSLTPASRTYAAELSAAHNLSANPSPAGMRDVRVDTVDALGRRAFRETAYQTQAKQQLTFVVWNAGSRNWVLTYATTASTSAAPATVSDDKVAGAARSITTKLPTGK